MNKRENELCGYLILKVRKILLNLTPSKLGINYKQSLPLSNGSGNPLLFGRCYFYIKILSLALAHSFVSLSFIIYCCTVLYCYILLQTIIHHCQIFTHKMVHFLSLSQFKPLSDLYSQTFSIQMDILDLMSFDLHTHTHTLRAHLIPI